MERKRSKRLKCAGAGGPGRRTHRLYPGPQVELSLGPRRHFVVFGVHAQVEFVQRPSAAGEAEQRGQEEEPHGGEGAGL
ncbi:hypothetical protein EYF80_057740 [Liparis tanakae]|uniref:Uncharacterized protein n=1 Tax=Liparis tanakae TaxID=230148 RepID=A0A4Z2EU47_9TELE|nr:hypothetical protein EYF80_057740 [Liparis tanakae]